MKKLFILGLTFLVCGILTSCEKFLDVSPRSQMPQDVLLSTQDGFKDALSGVYIQMKSSDIYGNQLMYGAVEGLISSWDVTANSTVQRIGLFQYEDEGVQNTFASIYRKSYSTIASINAILNRIDDQRGVFKNEEIYRMIKAELLGLRAYLHFDMLRLFGPIPKELDSSVRLPYVTQLSVQSNPLIGFDDFVGKLLADLQEAENLLQGVDPILQYSIAELRSPSETGAFNPDDEYTA